MRFQLTRPRGARLIVDDGCPHDTGFNSRAREGRDLNANSPMLTPPCFNSRAREGRDCLRRRCSRSGMFQLTRPRGARRDARCFEWAFFLFQLTRPRGARLNMELPSYVWDVSTHAPARGATLRRDNCHCLDRFNSRAREGRDKAVTDDGVRWQVSTHAPARGATVSGEDLLTGMCFNSRAREGRDSLTLTTIRAVQRFNSRAREGRDQANRSK